MLLKEYRICMPLTVEEVSELLFIYLLFFLLGFPLRAAEAAAALCFCLWTVCCKVGSDGFLFCFAPKLL